MKDQKIESIAKFTTLESELQASVGESVSACKSMLEYTPDSSDKILSQYSYSSMLTALLHIVKSPDRDTAITRLVDLCTIRLGE